MSESEETLHSLAADLFHFSDESDVLFCDLPDPLQSRYLKMAGHVVDLINQEREWYAEFLNKSGYAEAGKLMLAHAVIRARWKEVEHP